MTVQTGISEFLEVFLRFGPEPSIKKKNVLAPYLLRFIDKILLHKQSFIESTNNQLKYVFHLAYTTLKPYHWFYQYDCLLYRLCAKPALQLSNNERCLLTAA